jgi:GxxExxY protein
MLEFDPTDQARFPHKEITEAIIGAAFEVHNELGYGFLHRVYQNSLQIELTRRNFQSELEKRVNVHYKELVVGNYDADLVVNNCVIVEIKIAAQYDKRDEAQLLNLLKATGFKVGILINFGPSKVEFKRLIF